MISKQLVDPLTDHCLDTLHEHKSENEQFLSLLILSKVVQNGFYDNSHLSDIICEAIDINQVKKIIEKDSQRQIYRSPAFTILSFLCKKEKHLILSEILDMTPVFKEVLITRKLGAAAEASVVQDVTKCVLYIVHQKYGKERLIEEGFVEWLVDALGKCRFPMNVSVRSLFLLISNESGIIKNFAYFPIISKMFNKCSQAQGNLDLHLEIVELFGHFKIFLMRPPGDVEEALMATNIWNYLFCVAKIPYCVVKIIDLRIVEIFAEIFEKELFYTTNAFKILTLLAENDEMWSSYAQVMYKILEKAAWNFKNVDLENFIECENLNKIIPKLRQPEMHNFFRRGTRQSDWIQEGLERILSKKMSADQKEVGFQLISKLVNHFGAAWLIRRDGDQFSTKILASIFHLTCFEMKSLFDLSLLSKWMGKESISHYYICFNIISPVLHFIMAYSESGIFNKKQLKMFYKSFTKVFMAAIKLLETIERAARKIGEPVLDFPVPTNNSFYLISFLNTCFSRVDFLDQDHKIRTLPAILPIISENVNQIKDNSDTFLDLMSNFISGILDLTKNYKTVVILRFNFYRTLCIYLCKVLKQYLRNEFDPLVCDRIIQTCKLLKIIIDSDRNILKDGIFHSLLDNFINFLPDLNYIKDVWICKGSVSLIGMDIIKENGLMVENYRQETPMKVFFKAILKYLLDSHYIKKYNGKNFLVLRTDSKEEKETIFLWSICMERLCELLKTLPWTCDILLRIGWNAHLLRDLIALENVGNNQYFVNKVEMTLVRLILTRSYRKEFQKLLHDFDIPRICVRYGMNVLKALIHPNFDQINQRFCNNHYVS